MYLRTTQRKNTDGSVVRYVQLAHNHRVEGVTRADVLVNLGREDRLDREGLARLVASFNRYLGEADDVADSGGERVAVGDALTVVDSRPMGVAWLLDALWSHLGVDTALRAVLGRRKFTTDVERVLFALVANRAIDPASKLAAAEWASNDVAICGLEVMDEDQAYRAMDLLVEADTDAAVQEAVFFAVADLLNLEVDLLFFDTTSTYFETEHVDDLRRHGKSKDSRPDLPQIVIGLAVTREGIPVRCWVWPGNTNDNSILPEVKDGLRGWRLGGVVAVVDRGFSSAANLDYLRRAGGHWIAGEKMRDGTADVEAVLSRQGRYQSVRDNLRVKEVRLHGDESGKRWIICHNPYEAERDRAQRDAAVARVTEELDRINAARARDRRRPKKNRRSDDVHLRAECALRDHPSPGRWVRQLKSGRLRIDTAKVRAEQRLDGKFLLSTSDPDLSAEDVALGYKNLLEAERGFRDMKSTLDLRPVFHRIEPRIRGHVLLCWLALLLIRVAERRTGLTWRRIAIELGRIHTVTLSGTAGTVAQTTPLTEGQQGIVDACGIDAPPRVTHLDPS
jgi:transposase